MDFPDWTIAGEGCVKIGYDYARSVTGVEDEVELDLNEDDDVAVPDPQEEKTMVATTSEVCTAALCLDLYYLRTHDLQSCYVVFFFGLGTRGTRFGYS